MPARAPLVLLLLALALGGCDGGLKPPDQSTGSIRAFIAYPPPDQWPSADSLRDLRFVALRFVPRDTTDFFDLNRISFSDGLRRRVLRDTVLLRDVPATFYPYAGVAQQFSADLLDQRPVGLVPGDGFLVPRGDTVEVRVEVDFRSPPPFPPR
jgi:hypothetical protein